MSWTTSPLHGFQTVTSFVWSRILTTFRFHQRTRLSKVATPDMALNPLYDPKAVLSDEPPRSSSDQSDPWYVPKSMNFQSNLVVRNGIVFGYHSITPNEVWNFMANGNTRLEPVQNSYFGSPSPMIRMPAFWSECVTPETIPHRHLRHHG